MNEVAVSNVFGFFEVKHTDIWMMMFILFVNQINLSKSQMSATSQILNPTQIDQLCGIVHGILQQNKKNLDDSLAETVDIQNTSILRLYQLVVDEWGKKQKIIDNLCHFSLTMMATVQLLWDQKYDQNEKFQATHITINTLQAQLQSLAELNEMYKQKISEAETRIETIADAKDKIEEFVKSQSCINFSELIESNHGNMLDKKCSACQQHQSIQLEATELIKKNSKILTQKESQIEMLRNQKIKLEQQLQQAIEQSQLAKMQLELAEIAIKEALTYKTSYKSLLEQNKSKISQVGKQASNIHYFNGQIDCQSNMDDSFAQQNKNILSNQFACKQDIIHFASTPCLLLNQSIDNFNIDHSVEYKQQQTSKCPQNPFRKKLVESASNEQAIVHLKHESNIKEREVEDGQQDSFNENFEVWRPQSEILDEKKVKDIIKKFKIKQSKISDKQQTQESSFVSNQVLQYKRLQNLSRLQEAKSQVSFSESSISKFYSFVTNKVIRNRIKIK